MHAFRALARIATPRSFGTQRRLFRTTIELKRYRLQVAYRFNGSTAADSFI
jgi:hypothetical protein